MVRSRVPTWDTRTFARTDGSLRRFAVCRDRDVTGPIARVAVVMLTPEQQQLFVATARAFTPESGAWGRGGWTRVRLEDIDEDTLGEAVTLAWQNAAAKTARNTKASVKRKSPR